MEDDRFATVGEAYEEFLVNVGSDNPDAEWIMGPAGVYERNPAYFGPRGPSPDDDFDRGISGLECDPADLSWEELNRLTEPTIKTEDLPF